MRTEDGGHRLRLLPGSYGVARLEPEEALPGWAQGGGFTSVSRTAHELSIVCEENQVPETVRCERGWRCLAVQGPLDFSLTGVLASLAAPLAHSGVPIFAISTYDTDYLLVPGDRLEAALEALRGAGHVIRSDAG